MFSSSNSGTTGTGSTPADQQGQRPNPDHVFGDVFEDVCVPSHIPQPARREAHYLHQLLRPEVERHLPLWSWLGAACGAGLGFITANVPGLVIGACAGNRLGAIRDAKGKSVAAVFQDFSTTQRAEVRKCRVWYQRGPLIYSIDRYCKLSL